MAAAFTPEMKRYVELVDSQLGLNQQIAALRANIEAVEREVEKLRVASVFHVGPNTSERYIATDDHRLLYVRYAPSADLDAPRVRDAKVDVRIITPEL